MGAVPRIALPIHGRGAAINPPNRFEALRVEPDNEHLSEEELAAAPVGPKTHYFRDTSKSIIAQNDSPDVGFTHSVNPYRGCSHGCIYCYARPGHEYLGLSSGLDFETKIMVKLDAAELLRAELSSPKWDPVSLHFCGVTDCYQPAERQFRLTRQCIEVCAEFGNPISIITKNALITRDIEILAEMARRQLVMVILSVTTLDQELSRRMEPRTSVPRLRLEAIRKLSAAGVPTGVMFAPIIPGLTDHETSSILSAAAEAGARFAAYDGSSRWEARSTARGTAQTTAAASTAAASSAAAIRGSRARFSGE